jgi:N-acyl-phosphatidylethanolamine-hydrolysing phospholipase D
VSERPTHHTPSGFRNNYPTGWHRGSFWRWQRERWAQGVPRPPPGGWRFPSLKPDLAWLSSNRETPCITWIGHATFLIQLGGLNILTDPHLTARASPLNFAGPQRWTPPALECHELPPIDLVVLSHNHYDHLDLGTVRHLSRQPGGAPKFLVPLGVKAWFAREGISDVLELDWWEVTDFGGLKITFTPAQHWSARTTWDRNRSLWGGWRLDHSNFSFFFAGDTGYSRDFHDIAARLGPVDLAALPIGAYEPRWFMRASHVNPEEAVQIHLDLKARRSVAMHWGTFVLTDEPLDQPPHHLRLALNAQGLTEEDFWILKHGEMRRL